MIGTVQYWIELDGPARVQQHVCSVQQQRALLPPHPPPRAWTEFENKAWQPVQDWPIGFLTSSLSLSVIFSKTL